MDDSSLGMIISNLLIVFILLFVNGFFVAAEFAIVRARRTKIEQLTKDGNVDAKLALKALEDIDNYRNELKAKLDDAEKRMLSQCEILTSIRKKNQDIKGLLMIKKK